MPEKKTFWMFAVELCVVSVAAIGIWILLAVFGFHFMPGTVVAAVNSLYIAGEIEYVVE